MTIKQEIINEYLQGGITFPELSKKSGFGVRTICRWMATYHRPAVAVVGSQMAVNLPCMNQAEQAVEQPGELEELQQQLAEERLRVKLLTAMIEIAEEELKIPIRKKYGTKQ